MPARIAMRTNHPQLSIVMPVFNEATVIASVISDLEREIVARLGEVEIVVVNDRSTDDTSQILDDLAATHPHVRVHHADVNRGHGPSVRRGLGLARAEWIFQLDSDDQIPAADFWSLWQHRAEGELIIGRRVQRHDPRHRLWLSRVVEQITRRVSGRTVHDVNIPFKLIHRSVWSDVRPTISHDAVIPSILLTTGAILRGWRLVQLPVSHRARRSGPTTLRPVKLGIVSMRAFVELLAVRTRVARLPPRQHRGRPHEASQLNSQSR